MGCWNTHPHLKEEKLKSVRLQGNTHTATRKGNKCWLLWAAAPIDSMASKDESRHILHWGAESWSWLKTKASQAWIHDNDHIGSIVRGEKDLKPADLKAWPLSCLFGSSAHWAKEGEYRSSWESAKQWQAAKPMAMLWLPKESCHHRWVDKSFPSSFSFTSWHEPNYSLS